VDLFDSGRNNRSLIFGMMKFQVHASAYEMQLQHRAAPSRASNGDLNWLGTEFRMSRNERRAILLKDSRVTVMLGLDLQHGRGRQVAQEDAPFNLRLHDVVIHFIAEVGMRPEYMWTGGQAKPHPYSVECSTVARKKLCKRLIEQIRLVSAGFAM